MALVRAERSALLFAAACTFLSSPGQTFFISLFVGPVGQALDLGPSQLGTLYLGATLGAAALLPLTGHWIDRMDLRLYATSVMAGLALACGAMAVAGGPVGLFCGFLLLRLTGQGLMTHVAMTSVARHFRENRGRALSLVALGFPLAEAVMPAVAAALVATIGWRLGYAFVGLLVLAVAAPVLVWLVGSLPGFTRPEGLGGTGPRPRALDGLRIVVRTRFFWRALPILVFLPFAATALIFHVQAIAAAKGWPAELVAPSFAAYATGNAAGLLLSGVLVDRFGARAMLCLMNLPALVGIAILGLLDGWIALPVFLGLMGISSGSVQTTVAAVWAEVYGVARLGTIRSFAVMLMVGGTALGPATIGLMLDVGISVASLSGILVAAGSMAAFLVVGAPGIDGRRG